MPRTTGGGKGTAPTAGLDLPAASALVIGSIIGTGVFALPSALAPYGPISLVAFVAVTLGALALTIGALSKRVPASGGPYVYAREAFVNTGHRKWISVLLALVGLWIPAAINLTGVRTMGAFQVITTVLKFVPLVFMAPSGCCSSTPTTSARSTPEASRRWARSRPRAPSPSSATWASKPPPSSPDA
ncbi:amino acid permease [Streptomyces sp. NPDC001393]